MECPECGNDRKFRYGCCGSSTVTCLGCGYKADESEFSLSCPKCGANQVERVECERCHEVRLKCRSCGFNAPLRIFKTGILPSVRAEAPVCPECGESRDKMFIMPCCGTSSVRCRACGYQNPKRYFGLI